MTAVPDHCPTETCGLEIADLIRAHQSRVWRYLRYLGAQASEADDLTQETFLAVVRKPFEIRSEQETAAYLRRVARNQLLMLRRKHRRELTSEDFDVADAVWAEWATDNGWDDYLLALEDCLRGLQGRAREALDLRYRDAISREAMAERLAMKPDGVKTLLRRTRARLRECVERKVRP